MLKTLRLRRFLGAFAVILGIAALALAQTAAPPGACVNEDIGWKTLNGGCQDQLSGLVWSSRGAWRERKTVDWKYALNNCAALVEGGYDDWRLPTLAECQDARQHGAADPTTPHIQPWYDATMNPPYYYGRAWTATYKANKAYEYYFNDGSYELLRKGSGFDWYCVRP